MYNTKFGPLNKLRVRYFAYGLHNTYGVICGPFKTQEAAETSRAEDGLPHGPVYPVDAIALEALTILEKLEKEAGDVKETQITPLFPQNKPKTME